MECHDTFANSSSPQLASILLPYLERYAENAINGLASELKSHGISVHAAARFDPHLGSSITFKKDVPSCETGTFEHVDHGNLCPEQDDFYLSMLNMDFHTPDIMELGLFTDVQLEGNPGDELESSSQTGSSLSPSSGNIMTEHETGLSSATSPQSYWSSDNLGSTQAPPITGATQPRPKRRAGTPDASSVSACHQISLETQRHSPMEAPLNGNTVANRHKRPRADPQETSNSSCASSRASSEAAGHTNPASLHLRSVFGPGTKYNLSDKSLHEIADISENCMRPDLVEFLEERLTRWKKTGFWHQEQIPQPTANGAGREKLVDAYSCICRLESRMKDDQILNRVAVVMLHTAYEQACQEWRHAGAHQCKRRGRGDATTVIDEILSELHDDWDVGDKKRCHRSRFHDKKRFGKRWLVLIKSLGIGILLSSSQRLASAVHTTLFTGDMLQALVYCIRQSQAKQLLILELLNPIATLLVEGGRYEGIDPDRVISEVRALNSLTSSELKADASKRLAAGSDTMSNAIAGIMFYLARHDFARDQAAAEVRHQFASAEDIRQGPALAACTYLEACILESMRMAPPVATSPLERVTVGNGIEVDGHWFPAGITVGVCFYALNFNETIHKDPYRFWPERWLSREDGDTNGFTAEDVQQSKSNFFPFSAGSDIAPRGP
ncbi:ATP-dependent DNA helicase PIF1 [Fusarium mundagurra]|uniref:ATP-dependent DNA helicase PIF1 n=1 Tax=Fusarium mundagurra TaxID=1567541 RepID=A0A8H5YN84_9HYPO|nr:ATP-dependent DNA helicase PIF1 [Fusarium mundagurra]